MSLKAFHIFFIVVAVLLCFGFALWCFGGNDPGIGRFVMGALSGLLGILLVIYCKWFIGKYKDVQGD